MSCLLEFEGCGRNRLQFFVNRLSIMTASLFGPSDAPPLDERHNHVKSSRHGGKTIQLFTYFKTSSDL